ncbi:hypothetical protein [Frigoriglobus tundricola]|uniref:hypothetical protein n=1 Tax=Frigoriglobus tundricola TaxID=2774151 RepID=UPI00148EB2E1|nr:hypothetical protein [Frigoriglobus tundricola]
MFDVGNGFTVTVTASGKLRGVRATKNALERAVRLARKAIDAGITDDAPFQELLAAISEAEKLARAAQEANERVKNALFERRAAQAGDPQTTPNATTTSVTLP